MTLTAGTRFAHTRQPRAGARCDRTKHLQARAHSLDAPFTVGNEPTPNAVRLAALGGSGTMSLNTLDRIRTEQTAVPSARSMRVMETGLAFIAILVALLLNLGR